MTLYKHGVGSFERRAQLSGEEVELSFRVEEMNDVLKSLMAIDWGGGQVLGVDYATLQSREERLAGCSVRLGDERSQRDLLSGLRGRRVRLILDQGEEMVGTLRHHEPRIQARWREPKGSGRIPSSQFTMTIKEMIPHADQCGTV